MKRNATQLTGPSNSSTAKRLRANSNSAKRPPARQLKLTSWLDTPVVGIQGTDTPATLATGAAKSAAYHWPSTAQRKLENFRLGTPRHPPSIKKLPAEQGKPRLSAFTSGANKNDEDDDDGFKLFCSQTYTRSGSSQVPDDEEEDEGSQDGCRTRGYTQHGEEYERYGSTGLDLSYSQFWCRDENVPMPLTQAPDAPAGDDGLEVVDTQEGVTATAVFEEGTGCSQDQGRNAGGLTPVQLSLGPLSQLAAAAANVTSAAAAAQLQTQGSASGSGADALMLLQLEQQHQAAATTPELAGSSGDVHGDAPQRVGEAAAPALFPMFMPKSQRKHIVLIRHGESEYNRACSEEKSFQDPEIYDPELTAKGHSQCRNLLAKLAQLLPARAAEHGEPLWVVSPLTRAIQTFMESFPWPERLPTAEGQPAGAHPPLKLEFHPVLSEFVGTSGDVGRPVSLLMKEFPQFAEHLSKLPEHWWYQGSGAGGSRNCAVTKKLGQREPSPHRKSRVAELSRWLRSRPEKFIVLVGHAAFWKTFTGSQKYMNNCEIVSMTW